MISGGEGSDFIDGGADILKGANGFMRVKWHDDLKGLHIATDDVSPWRILPWPRWGSKAEDELAQYNALTVKSDAVFINSDISRMSI